MSKIDRFPAPARLNRCAIYTRKSVQPPVAQELTSLESQRAICASYVASQQHKSWIELEKRYDDAGRSGSNLDRPALQELMSDIELGLVDVVLVYKLDRITRTLLDFVRLIDFFDKYGVVFVAITQNFDTSDSMGRLIRNILLTFAQFEREIAIDRIRDKKSIMKQRGLWAGGAAPIGYDLRRGKLIINPDGAAAVQCIFETYVVEKRVTAVAHKLAELGFRTKVWRSKRGCQYGGNPISPGTVHHVLGNPIYIGEISHSGERYPGIHQPIIERALWDQAQTVRTERSRFKPSCPAHLLSDLLVDGFGRRMRSREAHTPYGLHRYYASRHETWAARQKIKIFTANANRVDQLVIEAIKAMLSDRPHLRLALMQAGVFAIELDKLAAAGSEAAVRLGRLSDRQLSCALRALVQRVELHSELTRIVLRLDAIPLFIKWDGVGLFGLGELESLRAKQVHVLDIPACIVRERQKHSLPLSHRSEASLRKPDERLTSTLEEARQALQLLFDNRETPIAALARSCGRRGLSFSRLVRLNYLAPDIVAAILDGEQPADLTRKKMMNMDLPIDWALQRRLLGFPQRPQSVLPMVAKDS